MHTEQNKINLKKILQDFSANLPHFPDGRIDYSASKEALVLTCFVQFEDKILLLQRSDKVGTYKKMWNSVAGYIDEIVPLEKKIFEELREELGLTEEAIEDVNIAQPYKFTDEKIDRTWTIVPCLAILKELPKISLDWEHIDYKWINPAEITDFNIVPELDRSLKNVLTNNSKI